MKISKDAARTARRIYSLCAPDGRLDESRLKQAVQTIVDRKPRDYRGILHALHRLVRLDEEARQAHVESAVELDAASKSRLEGNLNSQYGGGLNFTYGTKPELLGGLRVRVGNDVWDGSVKSRLDRLANSF